jgi:DNA polymerase I-like protein with 3'-5' exonuclease and polymerase domains
MIYFITPLHEEYKKRFSSVIFSHINVYSEEEGKALYFNKSKHHKNAYVDVEATGLDAHLEKILMTGIYFKGRYGKHFFIFDQFCNIADVVEDLANHYVVAHNAKYDIKMFHAETGILLKRIYDTMIAEQRLYMGMDFYYNYADTVARYTGKVVLKSTRNEFIGANPNTFRITSKQIDYLIGDLVDLETVKKRQRKSIKAVKQEFLIYGIEFPFIAVLAQAENKGIKLNTEKWLDNVKRQTEAKEILLNEMDELVRHYRDTFPDIDRSLLVGGKWDKKRIRASYADLVNKNGTIDIPNLFGEQSSIIDFFKKGKSNRIVQKAQKPAEYNGCLKYTKGEFLYILGALKQPAIRIDDTMGIPSLKKDNQTVTNPNEFSAKDDLIQRYLILKPNSPVKDFLIKYNKLQKLSKAIDTYGKSFIEKINPKTGCIHTIYRQADADTGRMQSGGGKKEPEKFNSQNMPRDKNYREPFEARPGYTFSTDDYTGAELMVMVSHAQDFDLLTLDATDMHSTLATNSWRNIYRYRANTYYNVLSKSELMEFSDVEEYQKLYAEAIENSVSFTVTKTEPEGYRQAFKPMGFGIIYGMYPKKAGFTLNISTQEGKIVIDTVKSMIPRTIKFVESQSEFAYNRGYVVFNTRTNSRRYFPILIERLKGKVNETTNFIDISEAKSSARNATIQGTQADFVKEASVKLAYYYWKNNIDALTLLWIHDELVCEIRADIAEEVSKKKQEIMIETANKYLKNVTIKVEGHLLPYWTK